MSNKKPRIRGEHLQNENSSVLLMSTHYKFVARAKEK